MVKKIQVICFIGICSFLMSCGIQEEQRYIEHENSTIYKTEDIEQENSTIYKTEDIEHENSTIYKTEDIEQEDSTVYIMEEYGEIRPYGGEFYYDEDTQGFYYHLDCFYLNSDFLYSMNDTLDMFYDEYLEQYLETENMYLEQGESDLPEGVVPYSELRFLGIQYIDNDYVSLLFNDVTYMGGAHPYSYYDAITINRCSGTEVSVAEILERTEEDILQEISDSMGLDEVAGWDELDFYLQDDSIVFFYRMPGYWEDVIIGR